MLPTHCTNRECGKTLTTVYEQRDGLCPDCWDEETMEIQQEEKRREERRKKPQP